LELHLSKEKNIDIESFRRTRAQKLHAGLNSALSSLFHRGWKETDARIEDCTIMPTHVHYGRSWDTQGIGGYAVGLSYVVDGKLFEAETISPVKVQIHETIKIRYNPAHPEQNNSFGSETNWAPTAVWIEFVLVALLLLTLVVFGVFMRG
jgi:hypothetical protein